MSLYEDIGQSLPEYKGLRFPSQCFSLAHSPCLREVEIGQDPINVDKFGGRPFLFLDEEWPLCEDEGPMVFCFQLTDPSKENGKTIQLFTCYCNTGDCFVLRYIDYSQPFREDVAVPEALLPADENSDKYHGPPCMPKSAFLLQGWTAKAEMLNYHIIKPLLGGDSLNMNLQNKIEKVWGEIKEEKARRKEILLELEKGKKTLREAISALGNPYFVDKAKAAAVDTAANPRKEAREFLRKIDWIGDRADLTPEEHVVAKAVELGFVPRAVSPGKSVGAMETLEKEFRAHLKELENITLKKLLSFPEEKINEMAQKFGVKTKYKLRKLIEEYNGKGYGRFKFGGHIDSTQDISHLSSHLIQMSDEDFMPFTWGDCGIAHIIEEDGEILQDIEWDCY